MRKLSYILSVDIGTSGSRASIFDSSGEEIYGCRSALRYRYESGEEDPGALAGLMIELVSSVSAKAEGLGVYPDLICVSSFWHSLMGVDKDGEPATPLYTWSNTSFGSEARILSKSLSETEIHNRTGCHFHSSYWPAKLFGLRRDSADDFARVDQWLSFPDYLHRLLTGNCVTSLSNASGTGLLNLRTLAWDAELRDFCGLRTDQLPVLDSNGPGDSLSSVWQTRWPVLRASRLITSIGDGAANNLGVGATGSQNAALMIGTSGALRVIDDEGIPFRIPNGLFCYLLDRKYKVIGGALSDAGSVYRWMNELVPDGLDDNEIESRLFDMAPGSHGLSALPFVFGERSTGYDEYARGALIGITRGSDAIDMMIAILESVGFRFADVLSRLREVCDPRNLIISGGAIENSSFLARMIGDILGRDLHKAGGDNASLRGAAIYGLYRSGVIKDLSDIPSPDVSIIEHDRDRFRGYKAWRAKHEEFYRRIKSEQ